MQCDGAGPLQDFQTITFGEEWQQLTRPTVQQTSMYNTPESNVALDNLVLNTATVASPAPEPETYAMFVAGLAMVGWARRRQRRILSTRQ